MKVFLHKCAVFCEAIKVSHSVFALPFAIAAAFIAASGLPRTGLLGKIILAVVLARTAAMAFNRWADADIDARNPRTANRAIPRGLLSKRFMAIAALLSAAGFVATSASINSLTFALSPVALAVLLGYSYTKRITSLSHVTLGLALGLSPLGAWVAVRGEFAVLPLLLGGAVLFWTAGFDVIYSCQDHAFDVRDRLHSLPRKLGIRGALMVSRLFHVVTVALLLAVGWRGELGGFYFAGISVVVALLVYEHSLVRADDLSRVNLAFFTLNGLVSLVFMVAVVLQTVS